MSSDRSMLFGVIAMQAELISEDQLAKACSVWSTRQEATLPEILTEQGLLLPEDQTHVDYLIERRLAKFGGDVRASLAASPASVRSVLASMTLAGGGQTLVAA